MTERLKKADTARRVPTVAYFYFVVLVRRTVEDAGPYNALSDFVSLPRLKGNSPIRGNVCIADKRVPVSGGKGGFVADEDGEVL